MNHSIAKFMSVRVLFGLLVVGLTLGSLSACGRRGALEEPVKPGALASKKLPPHPNGAPAGTSEHFVLDPVL